MSDWRDEFIKKATIRKCPNCGADGKGDISVFEEPIVIWARPGGEMKYASGMEQAMLICQSCGYTFFFTLKTIGINL